MNASPSFLRLRVLRDAIVVPRPILGDKALGAGVLEVRKGQRVVASDCGVRRRDREYVLDPPVDVEPTFEMESALYGGFLFAHYGHFLLESLSRTWFPPATDRTPIIWIPGTADQLTPWMSEMLGLAGIEVDPVVALGGDGPVLVRELLVPDAGFEVMRHLHPALSDRLGVVDARPEAGRRVWLSRSALGDHAGVEGEDMIERGLESLGWTVLHLERMSLTEQVTALAAADHIGCVEGSALHTLLFVRGFGGTIDMFSRHGNTNFEVIAERRGWDQLRHDLPGGEPTKWKRPSGARDVRWTGVDVDEAVRIIHTSSHRRG